MTLEICSDTEPCANKDCFGRYPTVQRGLRWFCKEHDPMAPIIPYSNLEEQTPMQATTTNDNTKLQARGKAPKPRATRPKQGPASPKSPRERLYLSPETRAAIRTAQRALARPADAMFPAQTPTADAVVRAGVKMLMDGTHHHSCQDIATALRALYDLQNGPPLPKYRDAWESAMRKAGIALEAAEVKA